MELRNFRLLKWALLSTVIIAFSSCKKEDPYIKDPYLQKKQDVVSAVNTAISTYELGLKNGTELDDIWAVIFKSNAATLAAGLDHYVYIWRVSDGIRQVHVDSTLVGFDMRTNANEKSPTLGLDIYNAATTAGAWVEYYFQKPGQTEVLKKRAYVRHSSDELYGFGSGYHEE